MTLNCSCQGDVGGVGVQVGPVRGWVRSSRMMDYPSSPSFYPFSLSHYPLDVNPTTIDSRDQALDLCMNVKYLFFYSCERGMGHGKWKTWVLVCFVISAFVLPQNRASVCGSEIRKGAFEAEDYIHWSMQSKKRKKESNKRWDPSLSIFLLGEKGEENKGRERLWRYEDSKVVAALSSFYPSLSLSSLPPEL